MYMAVLNRAWRFVYELINPRYQSFQLRHHRQDGFPDMVTQCTIRFFLINKQRTHAIFLQYKIDFNVFSNIWYILDGIFYIIIQIARNIYPMLRCLTSYFAIQNALFPLYQAICK